VECKWQLIDNKNNIITVFLMLKILVEKKIFKKKAYEQPNLENLKQK